MKIKVINLLVKIANGEKVPKKIKFMNSIWEYCKNGSTQDYINNYDKCLMEFLAINKNGLNQDVEIIEKPKKIEKIAIDNDTMVLNGYEIIQEQLFEVAHKVNELIDEINNLKEKEL